MTGEAYEQSAEISGIMAPFDGYRSSRCAGVAKPAAKDNVESMLGVIRQHRDAVERIQPSEDFAYLKDEARRSWDRALERGCEVGYRNAQVTVLAPTGTIAFLMDCDTTGIEPDIALVKYKLLAGGGMLKMVNRTVPEALRRLGYSASEVSAIEKHIEIHDTIEDVKTDDGAVVASGLKPEHLSVFDCAFKAFKGQRSIHYTAHLGMMAAAQPFISGAISKTVNLPNEATVGDIRNAYMDAWKLGLKCVAIYRDGSKRSQPLNTKKTNEGGAPEATPQVRTLELRLAELEGEVSHLREVAGHPARRRLPDTRAAFTHKFEIAGHEGYMTVGVFEDGQPGELFVTMAKEGSTIGGLMDTIGALTSMALQYGVPLDGLVKKFAHQRFEPSGFTRNPDIRSASSIIDYVFRWMACQFIAGYREATSPQAKQVELGLPGVESEEKKNVNRPVAELARVDDDATEVMASAVKSIKTTVTSNGTTQKHFVELGFAGNPEGKACPSCGSTKIQKTGACHTCLNCGTSLGCS